MRYIRTQAVLALIGLALVGGLLYIQSQGLATSVVPAAGGTYSEALIGQPQRFNPLFDYQNSVDRDIDRLIFSGLLKFDENGVPVPDLAETWAVSADGLSYTFVLRNNLRWHDGMPVTEEDAQFTIGLLQAADFPGAPDIAALWRSIEVIAPAPNTIRFVLPEPFAPFLDYVTVGLLPKHILGGVSAAQLLDHPFNLAPVGTGPMMMNSVIVEDGMIARVLLDANPHYYGPKPYLHHVQFVFFADAEAAYAELQSGNVLGLSQFTPQSLAAALQNSNIRLYSSRLPEYSMIFVNQKNEAVSFFQEKKVRQAMLLGLNRQWMVDNILQGQAFVATGPILPGTWAYNNNLIPVKFDPAAAAKLLGDAGWTLPADAVPGTPAYVRTKGGKSIEFTMLVPNDPTSVAIANLAVGNWADLGIRASIQLASPDDIKTALVDRTYQAALTNLSFTSTPDPDPYPFWHQTQINTGQNYSGFDSRDISEILEQARTTPSLTDRAKFYRAFQSKFTDQTPALLLYYPIYNYAVSAKVNGVQIGPLVDPSDRFDSMTNWYIVMRRVIENVAAP